MTSSHSVFVRRSAVMRAASWQRLHVWKNSSWAGSVVGACRLLGRGLSIGAAASSADRGKAKAATAMRYDGGRFIEACQL